jgi:hypothetical protein
MKKLTDTTDMLNEVYQVVLNNYVSIGRDNIKCIFDKIDDLQRTILNSIDTNPYPIDDYKLTNSGLLKLYRNGVFWNSYHNVDSMSQAKQLIDDENKKLGYE